MKQLWADLVRNLRGGLRLAFGLPVSLLAFRVSLRQLTLLFCFGVLLDIGLDYLRAGPAPRFSAYAAIVEGFDIALLLLVSTALGSWLRQPHLKLAIPTLAAAGAPALALLALAITGAAQDDGRIGAWSTFVGFWLLIAWLAFLYWRVVATALMPRRPHFWRRTFGGATLLLILVPIAIWANRPWWYGANAAPGGEAGYPSPASEEVLAAQPELLDDALDALEDERPGLVDLYFVGFAPYAREDVFRKDVERARDLLDDRFDTDGRSIVLINNPRTMLDDPLATVTNLKATLNEIGKTINPDEDVVMLYLASHGSKDHSLAIEFWPLELTQLTPGALRKMLDDSGIKWRIVVVSACYSGGYIDALKDDNTLVITASATDRQSFGCGNESDSTYFGDAFFNRALRFDDSFVKAFEQARDYVAKREKAEGQSPPSNPQMVLGSAMAAKLKELEQALRERRSTGNI